MPKAETETEGLWARLSVSRYIAKLSRQESMAYSSIMRVRTSFSACRSLIHATISVQLLCFSVSSQSVIGVTDITYIRIHEGWLYLAVVVDLFSRKIISWSMQSRMTKDIVLNALLMAVWRRNPQKQVLVHSDQGSQYTSHEWQSFLKSHGLEGSMSRRGNCHDNAVAESFFQLLKRERIKKKIYETREEARSDIFDYNEMFYNSKRRHGSSNQMPPTEYENNIIDGSEVSGLSVAIQGNRSTRR